MSKNKSEVSPKEFVRAWESSSSLAEVEEKTGIPASIAAARASMYRKKHKINLKMFRTGRKNVIDVAELNKLIELMGGRPADETAVETPLQQVGDKTPEQLRAEEEARQRRNAATLRKLLGGTK